MKASSAWKSCWGEQALKNMVERVDSSDLRFFAVSVIIQKESGGNLAEILDSIGSLIRSRFKLRGKIRTLSAEGRFSAIVLAGLPFAIAGVLLFLNREYITILMTAPVGQLLCAISAGMMLTGILAMKKMVAIRV